MGNSNKGKDLSDLVLGKKGEKYDHSAARRKALYTLVLSFFFAGVMVLALKSFTGTLSDSKMRKVVYKEVKIGEKDAILRTEREGEKETASIYLKANKDMYDGEYSRAGFREKDDYE